MKLLAIDGNSIMNRAFYGIKALSNKKGAFTNALVGFMNIYLKALEEVQPDHIAVAFDVHAPTFRHQADASYKATRKGMPEELREQMPRIKELLKALGVAVVELEGFEADDVLGTLARIFYEENGQAVILTGDRDSLQLINERVSIRLATTKETILYTPERFAADYAGLNPIQLIDLKALMGDSSDNIPGVAGIGQKTALNLICQFESVEKLYEALDDNTASGLRDTMKNKLLSGREAARQSKWLATIRLDAPIPQETEHYLPGAADAEETIRLLSEWEMFALLKRLNLKMNPSENSGESFAKIQREHNRTAIPLVITQCTPELQKEWQTDHESAEPVDFMLDSRDAEQPPALRIRQGLHLYTLTDEKKLLQFFSSPCPKRTSGAKAVYKYCFSRNSILRNLRLDCEIAAYLLRSTPIDGGVQVLCQSMQAPYDDQYGEEYNDVASLSILSVRLSAEIINTGMESLLTDVEQPLTETLASMEVLGVGIDKKGVEDFGMELREELSEIEKEIYRLAGRSFNILSPKQLGEVLFVDLGLPSGKKTKTGYSTNAEVLEFLRDQHPVIELILQYRQLSKLASTYVDGLLKTVGPDGRIHSNFKQTETRTGRISSTEPNLQNIPVRTELGASMRKFFVAAPGKIFLDADYSQIELRVVASLSEDETMREAFLSGMDVHTVTASQVFGLPPEMVTPGMRRAAKAVNFGIIYGIGAFSLAKDINVSVAEAKKYISSYLAHYPKVDAYMKETVRNARQNGYVTTYFGRRRYIPELSATNKMQQAFGERAAMNAPIQGTAADVIKIAMVRVFQRLRQEGLSARLILQIHDELIVETTPEDADRAAVVLQEEMQGAADFAVPLTAEVSRGECWYDAKG